MPPLEAATVWPHGPEERAFPVIPDTGLRHVGAAPYRPAEPEESGIRPGPELSADARLVQVVRAAVARADYRGDAFPLLNRQQPERAPTAGTGQWRSWTAISGWGSEARSSSVQAAC